MEIPTVTVSDLADPLPEGLLVLDVREDDEWDAGHVDGAVHVPLSQLAGRAEELPDQQTLVVCRVGGRSAQATAYLLQQGRDVVNLAGGMAAWAGAGRPLVTETGEAAHVL